jgi:hypothetical protein
MMMISHPNSRLCHLHRALCALFAALSLLVVTPPANAFDAFMMAGQHAVQYSFDTMRNVTATNAMNAAVQPRGNRRSAAGTVAGQDGTRTFSPMADGTPGVARPLRYQPTAALEQETARAIIARLKANDTAVARAVPPFLERPG